MSHMVETMAYAGEVPWHGLGKEVPHDLSPEQMLEAAELNWEVVKVPQYITFEGKKVYTKKHALVRATDGMILDTVSEDWKHLQNLDAFKFFNDFVNSGDMQMHTAGSLRLGQIVWALAKVNDSFELFGGDKVDSYLLFTLPHKFGQSIDVRFTPIRVVCNNTLTLSLGIKSQYVVKVSHRKEFDPEQVKQTLGIAASKLQQYKEMAQFLGSKMYKNESVKEYFMRVFPSHASKKQPNTFTDDLMSRPAKTALEVLHTQPGAKYAEGSWWQAFNSVTFCIDHLLGRQTDTRLNSAWFGVNRGKKIQALETAVKMAEVA